MKYDFEAKFIYRGKEKKILWNLEAKNMTEAWLKGLDLIDKQEQKPGYRFYGDCVCVEAGDV